MIDTATIFFSTLMCLLVVFRAIRLDGQLPWFGRGPGAASKWGPPGSDTESVRSRNGTLDRPAHRTHDDAA